MTALEAIEVLIKGTGLSVSTNGNGVFAIKPVPAPSKERVSEAVPLERVVVTAQKRDEHPIDVPISLVVVTADELEKRKIVNIDDLPSAVPGLAIRSNGSYTRQIAIRGVANSAGNSNLIGVYLDEVPATSPLTNYQLDLRTYDLERVEVLRGPQGTLYGEGSVGGTVRFITHSPLLDRFEMKADVAALFTQDGAPSQRIESVVNIPVIDNKFGLRIAGTFDHEGGWIDQPAANRTDFNQQNLVDLRVKALWKPVPGFSAAGTILVHRDNQPPSNAEDANGNFTQVFQQLTTPDATDDYNLYDVTLTYDLPWARLLSSTSYVHQDKSLKNIGTTRQLAPPGSPVPLFNVLFPLAEFSGSSYSEELRLTSRDAAPVEWTAGAFFRNAEPRQSIPAAYIGPAGPLPLNPIPATFTDTQSKSWALFGDARYEVSDKLGVGAGLRYFQDEQKDLVSGRSAKFDSTSPRVYGQYQVADQFNTYASVAKGFRSGGFNGAGQPNYGPESAWTYELGLKGDFDRGQITSDFAIFQTDYNDFQISGAVLSPTSATGLLSITSNAGDVRIRGVEWALNWRPDRVWTLGFNATYLDAKFVTVATFPSPTTGLPTSPNIVGDRVQGIPEYQFTVSAQRDFSWDGRLGFVRVDYSQQGPMEYRVRSIGPWYVSYSDQINMLNANVGFQWRQGLSFNLFAQNLLNDRGYTGSNSIEGLAARARPRTVGASFGVSFN